jgi:alkylated DNA repair protein (DNA oxidative demethylase)
MAFVDNDEPGMARVAGDLGIHGLHIGLVAFERLHEIAPFVEQHAGDAMLRISSAAFIHQREQLIAPQLADRRTHIDNEPNLHEPTINGHRPAMSSQPSLFETNHQPVELDVGFFLLPGFADTTPVLADIAHIVRQAPFRHMQVSGGKRMSVAMSNCGPWGWVSSASGYGYSAVDPLSGLPWPDMPLSFQTLARTAAEAAGFQHFEPDACLINQYASGAALGVHQDRDEQDFTQPIVSVSIGASATFQLGGLKRSEPLRQIPLHDGDVLVWGGPARLRFHGVKALKPPSGEPPLRHNLTFRRAQ